MWAVRCVVLVSEMWRWEFDVCGEELASEVEVQVWSCACVRACVCACARACVFARGVRVCLARCAWGVECGVPSVDLGCGVWGRGGVGACVRARAGG